MYTFSTMEVELVDNYRHRLSGEDRNVSVVTVQERLYLCTTSAQRKTSQLSFTNTIEKLTKTVTDRRRLCSFHQPDAQQIICLRMYYETKVGDNELQTLYQAKLAEESAELDDDGEPKPNKQRKRRRNEASILEQENETDRLSDARPKRAAAIRPTETNAGQRRIDEFIAKKRSPRKSPTKFFKPDSILPSLPTSSSERCPVCDRLIANDILETHTNACLIQNSDAAKELLEKSKQRAKTEAKAKEVLFQRTTRKSLASHLIRANSETTTCPTCHMQMTVSRLENQHKNECSKRLQS